MSYSYTFTGAPQSTIEEYNGISKRTDYTYDERCRLISETTTVSTNTTAQPGNASTNPSATITYGYDALGNLVSKTYGNGVTETINYNIQGWQTATAVTNGNSNSNIYSQQLKYYNPTKGSTPLYTGNISEWSTTMGPQAMNTYGFEYDKLGRLKNTLYYSAAATTPTNSYTERGITYDLNGNITTLKRYAASEATPEDDYQYIYTGNKLTQIAGTDNNDTISNATYTYDSNGNMRSDGLKNLQISYNFLNLPSVVTQDDTPVAEYSWFADGSKYRVLTQQNNGYIYTGSLIYASNNGNLQIESTDFAGGRINIVENTLTNTFSQDIQYHHTDHLGSVRAITNQNGETVEQNAYYPFGSRHTFGNTYAQTTNRFKFNGKEEQTAGNLGLLDYGARMYDANIGRWTTQDPLAEKMYGITPYRFSLNNPVNIVDPDGLFETRKEARQYKREYDTGGYVDKNDDGTYSINNKKAGYSYSKQADADPNTIGLDENGVVKSIIVTPYTHNENPIIQSIYDGQQDFIENPITKFIASTIFCVTAEGVIISSLQSTSLLSNATTFDHLLSRLPLEKHRKSILYFKKGNYRTACRDFKKLNVKEINQYKTKNGIVKAGRDRNGNEIIVRQCSSHNGYPTLERQIKRNNTTIKYEKIRYR